MIMMVHGFTVALAATNNDTPQVASSLTRLLAILLEEQKQPTEYSSLY